MINDDKPQKSLSRYDLHNSPFIELQAPLTLLEILKFIIFLPLVPIKVLICSIVLGIMSVGSFIAIAGIPIDQPLPPSRRAVARISSKLGWVIMWMYGYYHVKVTGWDNYKKAQRINCISTFNHVSFLDSVLLLALFAPSGVSKAGNLKIPVVGWLIRAYQNVYVPDSNLIKKSSLLQLKKNNENDINGHKNDTNNKQATVSTVELIRKHIYEDQMPLLAMAPEGTTSSGKQLLQFRRGAFVPGAPVLPICLKYKFSPVSPAWTITSIPFQAMRLATQFYNKLEVIILPLYYPSDEEKKDPEKFANGVRLKMAKALDIPLVEQSQFEYRLLYDSGVRTSLDGMKIMLGNKEYINRYIDLEPQISLLQNGQKSNGKQD